MPRTPASGRLRTSAGRGTVRGPAGGWFFERHAGPERHVRLRFHTDPAALVGPLTEQACAWADGPGTDGLCAKSSFDI